MNSLKKIFLKDPGKPAFWLIMGIIFKGILFFAVLCHHPYRDIAGIWGATQADDSSYLVPIDNLLQHGSYTPDFRMPGYGIFYFIFRLVFTQIGACNALIILQLLLASASVYFLALTAYAIFKKDSVFYLTFYLFLSCSFSNFFDAYIASESLCTSLLIFSIYFFTRYFQQLQTKYLLYAGLLATWVMFIRPVFGGILPACCFILLFQKRIQFFSKINYVLLFLLPFIFLEGSWIYRNFQVHKKLILFTTTGSFYPEAANSYLEPLFEFTQSWGGVCSYTNKPVDMDWFQYYYPGLSLIRHFDSLPNDIYTSAFNKDSLILLKKMIISLRNPSMDTTTASGYQYHLRKKLEEYRLSVKRDRPFQYFIQAPLKMMGVMLYGPVTRNFLDRGQSVPIFGKLLTSFNYFIYFLIILTGLPGALILTFKEFQQAPLHLIVPFIPFYTILIHPLMFRFFDPRFLIPAFPFLLLCAAFLIQAIYVRATEQRPKG